MMITMKNEAGMVKEVKKGWSWTTFFFGLFVPLIRGDIKWAGIMLLVNILASLLTSGLSVFVTVPLFAATYNKVYMKDLYEKGYRPTDPNMADLVLNYVNS